MSVRDATTRLEALEEMADVLSHAIDDCNSTRDLPALVKQLREVLQEIGTLAPPQGEESRVDRIKRLRSASS